MEGVAPESVSEMHKRRAAARREGNALYVTRRQEILRAAALLFRERGLAETTVADIADAVGTDRTTIYYYAGSKEEIFEEIVRDVFAGGLASGQRVQQRDASPRQRLHDLLLELMVSFETYYPYAYVFAREDVRQLPPASVELIVEYARGYNRLLRSVLEEGLADGSFTSTLPPSILAHSLIGIVSWSHRWYQPGGQLSAETIGRGLAALVLEGLCGHESRPQRPTTGSS
jgi:AcrR family transcriptional regulator